LSGCFGADFTQQSLLAQYPPLDLTRLPTTNCEQGTGDGIKIGKAVGGKIIGFKWVKVRPTGLVNPEDPDAKIKFLAAAALLASMASSWMQTASASRTSSADVRVRCGRLSRLSP